ncbi:MAG TPA: DUF6093 family protein [Acidimicrobiales bacterium]
MTDLADLRALVEAEMLDACTITRDREGVGDDVRNEETGALEPPAPDTTTVYTGPCLFVAASRTRQSRDEEQGGAAVYPVEYDCRIPLSAPVVERGDVVTVTAVGPDGDESLIDRPLVVVGVERVSKTVARRLSLYEAERGPRV